MTPRELEILHTIYRLGGQCSIRKMSKEVSLSSDYTFLISTGLLKQKLIKKIANNVFILTASGMSFLEHLRNGSQEKKTPILIEVSRSFDSGVEVPSFDPEIHFINPEAIPSGCYGAGKELIVEHNLGRDPITQVADARSIQKSIKRLTFVNRKGPKMH
jgi:predicted transcriptional regulator